MSDVVVTVPKGLWDEWLDEGDLAYEPRNLALPAIPALWSEEAEYHFWIPQQGALRIRKDERVYIVAHGRVRGFAPLVRIEHYCKLRPDRSCLVRRGLAEPVTIPEAVRGFQGLRYRWWDRSIEVPFPGWKTP